ncbi:MAG: glutathione S-transferase [Rhodobacter sp.]|nr:glutathione S-transferase [Rhodobacter sp.]
MTYELFIGDRSYSSWSLRGWLLFEPFGIPVTIRHIAFNAGPVAEQLSDLPPAQTVPVLRTPEGAVVAESLAIAEELATRHPDAGHWPADPLARATARALAAEMHSGFAALRENCPMNLRAAYADYVPPEEVREDLARLETIWSHARATCQPAGPWLCGDYSTADVFFAPVAARIATYGLPVGPEAQAYVAAHLADPAVRRWRAMGLAKGDTLPWYARDYTLTDWPGPEPLPATPSDGPSENTACPYSGEPVTHFLELDGRTFGFCNAFCRDKTMADPEAWPAFTRLLNTP